MSAGERRPLAEAEDIARDFRVNGLNAYASCTHWLECGSIRRRCKTVGDIEIVAIAKTDVDGTSKLWRHIDILRDASIVTPATHMRPGSDKPTLTWGDTYRKFFWGGWQFDLFTATPDNYWLQIVIRTGNWIFSNRLMSSIKRQGKYRIGEGYIRPWFEKSEDFPGEKRGLTKKGILALPIIPAQSEEHVLSLAGPDFTIPPTEREWEEERR